MRGNNVNALFIDTWNRIFGNYFVFLYLISVKIIKHCFGFNLFPVFFCPTVIEKYNVYIGS